MVSIKNFAQIALNGFSDEQRQIIDTFVGEDIVLRREVPPAGLSSLGLSNISFTYDEMRDFLLAHFVIHQLSKDDPDAVTAMFDNIKKWPIYEGFFRYAYILARKEVNDHVTALCEANDDFQSHYLNNLPLLSPDIQSETDVSTIRELLAKPASDRNLRRLFRFLFRKRVLSDPLNIQLLLDHLAALKDTGLEAFARGAFSSSGGYRDDEWRDQVGNLLKSLLSLSREQQIGVGEAALAVSLFFTPFARWDEREAVKNLFSERFEVPEFSCALERCAKTVSELVSECLVEITQVASSS
jgi:hypothetical protein